jgi:uncharacterized membrane protein (UPF0127 family)
MSRRSFLLFEFVILLIVLVLTGLNFYYRTLHADTSYELTLNDSHTRLEIADTLEEQYNGLSGRSSLSKHDALLFVFNREDYWGIWMKDMKFPIDIFWLDKNKVVVMIKENATPESYPETFRPTIPSLYALETVSGFASEHQVKVGDTLTIEKK